MKEQKRYSDFKTFTAFILDTQSDSKFILKETCDEPDADKQSDMTALEH